MFNQNKRIIAITGPSGVGKSTLGDNLLRNDNISVPVHSTTRQRRSDDVLGMYRYLTHDEYRDLLNQNKFLISSGDGPVVMPQYGNFYGVLKEDCLSSWENNDIIILFVSYKDIYTLIDLMVQGVNIDIVNLRFMNIETGVLNRLQNDERRNFSIDVINKRIICAIDDDQKYGEIVKKYASCVIYTDEIVAEETYNEVCKQLNLNGHVKKLIKKDRW